MDDRSIARELFGGGRIRWIFGGRGLSWGWSLRTFRQLIAKIQLQLALRSFHAFQQHPVTIDVRHFISMDDIAHSEYLPADNHQGTSIVSADRLELQSGRCRPAVFRETGFR